MSIQSRLPGFQVTFEMPLVEKARLVLEELEELMAGALRQWGRGRKGWGKRVLFRMVVLRHAAGMASFAEVRRQLECSRELREVVGLDPQGAEMPSPAAISRFFAFLSEREELLTRAFKEGARRLAETLPGLGDHLSADSTMIRSYANGHGEKERRKERRGRDSEAKWGVKCGNEGKGKKYVFGYKLHLLVDSHWEAPVAFEVTPANVHDGRRLEGLLNEAEEVLPQRNGLRYLAADTAYDSEANCRMLWQRGYIPLIPLNPGTVPQDQDLLDKQGMALCAFTHERFSYAGRDGNYTKWRCPYARQGKRMLCDKQHRCSRSPYGETIKLSISEHPRLHAPLPRGTHRFRREFAKRTSVEHVFSRLKCSLAADDVTVLGQKKVRTHLLLSLLCYQALTLYHYRKARKLKQAA